MKKTITMADIKARQTFLGTGQVFMNPKPEPDPFSDVESEITELPVVEEIIYEISFEQTHKNAKDPEHLSSGFIALSSCEQTLVIQPGAREYVAIGWRIAVPSGFALLVHAYDPRTQSIQSTTVGNLTDDQPFLARILLENRTRDPINIFEGEWVALVELRKIQPADIAILENTK